MKYVVLISHGDFAPGLESAVKMMVGQREDLVSASLKDGKSVDDFLAELEKALAPITQEDEILMFCDILGGSPLTSSLELLHNRGLLPKTKVLTGMNMPMVITAMTMKDNVDLPTLVDMVLMEGKEGISEFELDTEEADEDDI